MSARNRCCWRAPARRCSRWRPSAATITGRSPKVSLVGDTVRCPWHHACFSLRTGEALHAPALSPIDCWSVEQRDGKVFVTEKRADVKPAPRGKPAGTAPDRIVIVGGGAAGFAAAEMLRRQDYKGSIVMLSNDDAAPVDRPNLSKDYLAGNAPEEWIPLRGDDFYSDNAIELRLKANVAAIDPRAREVVARRWRQGCLRPPAAGDRRRAGPAADSRAPTSRMSIRCAAWPTAAPSSSSPRRRAAPS